MGADQTRVFSKLGKIRILAPMTAASRHGVRTKEHAVTPSVSASAILILTLCLGACSHASPTAPSPPPIVVNQPPAVVTPPVVAPPISTPPVAPVTPPAIFPPQDPRFDLVFYRQFVHNALAGPLEPLRRQPVAPRLYLRTVDDAGRPIDAVTLDHTAAALINVAGSLTGVFGLAGLERGTETREGVRGWITVRWSAQAETFCGLGYVGGDLVILAPRTPGCRCDGNPASINPSTVKHELGHALGFWHTPHREDLMYVGNEGLCDQQPSAREVYHASVAYTRPIGITAP